MLSPVIMIVAALCAVMMIATRWVLDQWNDHAAQSITAEQRAPTAVEMLRHSITDSDDSAARSSAARRAAFAADRARRLDAASSRSAAALIMSSSTPVSASASAASLSLARQEAKLAELRAQQASSSSGDQRPPEDSPWSIIGAHRRRAREQAAVDAIAGAMDDAASSVSASSTPASASARRQPTAGDHVKAFLEEIHSSDDDELEQSRAQQAEENSLLIDEAASAPVDEALMISEGRALMSLLRSGPDAAGSSIISVAALRDPDSGPYLALHRALVRYAALLGHLPASALHAWSAAICSVFVRDRGFDRLEFVMRAAVAEDSQASAPFALQKQQALDLEAMERALEMKHCAERILHTLVPLVWTA